jgi:predicted transcriptional regulator
MSFSYFSKICGRFADAELVIKKPHGGREKRYILTEKGKLLREHLIELIKILKEGKDV